MFRIVLEISKLSLILSSTVRKKQLELSLTLITSQKILSPIIETIKHSLERI